MNYGRSLKTILVITAIAVLGALLVWAFIEGRKELAVEAEQERPVKVAPRVSVQGGENIVTIDRDTQAGSGIVSAALSPIRHMDQVKSYGVVRSAQELPDLRNGYASAAGRLEEAQAMLDASRKEYGRLHKLYQDDRNISDKSLQESEAKWRSDTARTRIAQEAVRSAKANVQQRLGMVIGDWVCSDSPALERLIRGQDLLVQITLPPGLPPFSPPERATVQSPAGHPVPVKLVSISPNTDPRIQGASLLYLANSRASGLLPGMNVLAGVPAGHEREGVIIPASAVVWWQGKAFVYLQKDAARFVRREILTDTPLEAGWFVQQGFAAGERIVVEGAQLLLSEEFRARIQIND